MATLDEENDPNLASEDKQNDEDFDKARADEENQIDGQEKNDSDKWEAQT